MNSDDLRVGKFQLGSDFRESVFKEKLRGEGSPTNAGKPLRSSFLSFYLLLVRLIFFLSPPHSQFRHPERCASQRCCVGSCCFFFYCQPLGSFFPFWGRLFPRLTKGNHLSERTRARLVH